MTDTDLPIGELLNDDCLLEIFSYVPITDILQLEKVNKRWYTLCQESWKSVYSLECNSSTWYLSRKSFVGFCRNEVKSLNVLMVILKKCSSKIQHFELSYQCSRNREIFTFLLKNILESCKNLKVIKIASCGSLSTNHLNLLKDNCQNIEELTIRRINIGLEENLSQLLNNIKKLKYFSLGDVPSPLSCEFLNHISPDTIEEIHLPKCDNFQPQFFSSAMKKFNKLRIFTCGPDLFFNDSILKSFGKVKTLTKLYLDCPLSNITGVGFSHLSTLINLQELIITYNIQLKNDAIKNIANNCKQLKLLEITTCISITNKGLASISNLSKLEVLKMNGLSEVTDKPISIFPNTLKILMCGKCKNIKDRGIMTLIERAPNLSKLDLSFSAITNTTIEKAIEITNKRKNGIVLEIGVRGTTTNLVTTTEVSPFLKINEHTLD